MTPVASRRRIRAATDGADRFTRLAIWLNDSRASRWISPMMAQSVAANSVPHGMKPYPAHYVANRTRDPRMCFVRDGEDAACLASVQVSTPQPGEVADPAHWVYIARAVTVVADGWAHAIPVPTGL